MYGVWVYSSSPVRVEFYVRFLHRLVEGFKRTLLGLLSPTMKSVMQTPPRHTRRLEQDALLFLDPCSEGAWRCKVEDEMHTKGHAITQFWCVPSMQRLDVCNTLCKWSFGVRLVAAEWLRGSLNEWMNELDTSSEEHHVCPANFKAICESDQTGFSVERNTISPKGPFSSSTRGFLSYHTFFPISFRVYPLRTPIILLWLVDAQLSWSGPKWWTWQSNWSICNSHYSLLSRWTFISFFFFWLMFISYISLLHLIYFHASSLDYCTSFISHTDFWPCCGKVHYNETWLQSFALGDGQIPRLTGAFSAFLPSGSAIM